MSDSAPTHPPESQRAEPLAVAGRRAIDWFELSPDLCAVLAPDGWLLAINRAGARCLGVEQAQPGDRSFGDLVHPDDRDDVLAALDRMPGGGGQGELEFRLACADGALVWMHGHVSLQRDAAGRPEQLLVTCCDITGRKQTELALQRRVELERLLGSISARFVDRLPHDIDALLAQALAAVGLFAGACRSYVFQFSGDRQTMSNTHEWCAEGVTPHRRHLQGLPMSEFAWGLRPMLAGEVLQVPDVAALPPEAAAEKAEFEREGIRSLINVPLLVDGQVTGFFGFDSVRQARTWSDDDVALLKIVAQMLAGAIGRHWINRALRDSAEKVRLLLEYTGEGIFGLDRDGICTLANPACVQLLGYRDASDLIGRNMHELTHHSRADGSPYPLVECRVASPIRDGRPVHVEGEVFWRADGTSFPVEYRSHPIYQAGAVVGAVVTFSDITEREHARERLTYLAEHDALTGLPNRYLFLDRLNSGIARARRSEEPLALLYIDLDEFKPINDRFGHHQGDVTLKGVADRLRHSVREMDTVARIGGDEFAVILEGVPTRGGAAAVADKIASDLREPFAVQGQSVSIGASIGIAMYPGDGADPDALLRFADQAMYRIKRSGVQDRSR